MASISADRRIRVRMVMPSYYPVVGGMEIQVERQIPFLRERGIDVSILTRQTPGTSRHEVRDGVEIRRVPIPGGPGMRSIAFTARGSVQMVRDRREIDVIHAHSVMSATTAAAIAKRVARTPALITVHSSYELSHLLAKPIGASRLRWYVRTRTPFVSISSGIGRLLLDHGVPAPSVKAIPNGIDTARFAPASDAERAKLRSELGLPANTPIVVFVGRLEPVKNVDVLLNAWSGIDGGHLLILGDGVQRAALVAQAQSLGLSDRVDFRGMVTNIVDYLRAADIFVLPSSSEGLSVALLEAMATGLVPIATAIGGTTDVVDDQQTGLLVQPGDVSGLRDALNYAIGTPSWREAISQNARDLTTSTYDLRVVTARLATLYRELATNE